MRRKIDWLIFFSYLFIVYSSLFYGKEIAKSVYKALGYHYYSYLISLISIIGILLILSILKSNYTFFELLFIVLIIIVNSISYFMTSFPTDRLHLLEYMLLGVLLFRALDNENIKRENMKIILSFIIIMAIAVEDEILQSYLPNRDAQIEDILRDCIGGLSGVFIGYISRKKKEGRKQI